MAGCTTCGQPLRPDAYWCELCGTRVVAPNDRVSVAPGAPRVTTDDTPAPVARPSRARVRRIAGAPLPPARHAPTRIRRSRTVGTSIFGWLVIAVIALSLVGGALNAARDTSSESETGFDIPVGTLQTAAYESSSGLYSIDFPIAVEGDTPAERAEPMVLTASTGSLLTNIVGTSAVGVANFEVQEARLLANHPPGSQLATERCNDNDANAVLTEIRVASRAAWQCQWKVPNGFEADEVFLTVGDTALVLRGVTMPAAFDAFGQDNPFNAMVNSLQILRPD